MKSILLVVWAFFLNPFLFADVYVDLYDAESMVELDNYDVMAGMELVVMVSSDANEPWYGGIFIEGDDRGEGVVSSRNSDRNISSGDLSVLESAGTGATVTSYRDYSVWGFDMQTGDNVAAGDWFVFDYTVANKGLCNISTYSYEELVADSFDTADPNMTMQLSQSKTRDFNDDGYVNFIDFSVLASYWLDPNCVDCSDCIAADFDEDEIVDVNDIVLFSEYWLWGITDWVATEPNVPEYVYPVDPNATFSIVDANGLDEITLSVGESARLYMNYSAVDPDISDLLFFDVEANISDPNLGSIDNAAYGTNDPNNLPTAEILVASPMITDFGPGETQSEGIHLMAFRMATIAEGNLASFVYTAKQEGDITLIILNKMSPYPLLQSIVIHQVE